MFRIAWPAVAFLLLGAHFSRSGVLPGTLVAIALAAALIVPHPRVPTLSTVGLGLATLEWLRTLYVLVTARAAMHLPWARLALILAAVALFTAVSAIVFRNPRVRAWYGLA